MLKKNILSFLIIVFIVIFFIIFQLFNLDEKENSLISMAKDQSVSTHWEGILWPAMGHPAIIDYDSEEQTRLTVYLSSSEFSPSHDMISKAQLIAIDTPDDDFILDLNLISAKSVDLKKVSEPGPFAEWVVLNTPNVNKLTFALSDQKIDKINFSQLFDLSIMIKGKEYKKLNSVCLRRSHSGPSHILIATDIHVASRWDEIEHNIKHLFPEKSLNHGDSQLIQESYFKNLINPNRNLSDLISDANQMHSKGELDFIVMTGDLVDL